MSEWLISKTPQIAVATRQSSHEECILPRRTQWTRDTVGGWCPTEGQKRGVSRSSRIRGPAGNKVCHSRSRDIHVVKMFPKATTAVAYVVATVTIKTVYVLTRRSPQLYSGKERAECQKPALVYGFHVLIPAKDNCNRTLSQDSDASITVLAPTLALVPTSCICPDTWLGPPVCTTATTGLR